MGGIYPRKSRKTGKVISYAVSWYDEDGERRFKTLPSAVSSRLL